MASGLRARQLKSYWSILGLRPVATSSSKTVPAKKKQHSASTLSNCALVDQDNFEVHVDTEGEHELFEEEILDGEQLQEDLQLAEEDLETDQILALAAEEEERCHVLETEMEHLRREEAAHKLWEKEEALQHLWAIRSKRATLETSLSRSPAEVTLPPAGRQVAGPSRQVRHKSMGPPWGPQMTTHLLASIPSMHQA